jgi:hypothetical protein
MKQFNHIGDRIADKSSQPDERTVRDWMGAEAFEHWVELRSWIEASYPGVFAPDWLYGVPSRFGLLRTPIYAPLAGCRKAGEDGRQCPAEAYFSRTADHVTNASD